MTESLNDLQTSFDSVFHAMLHELHRRAWPMVETGALAQRYRHLSDELQRMIKHPLYQIRVSPLDEEELAQIKQLRDGTLFLLRDEKRASSTS